MQTVQASQLDQISKVWLNFTIWTKFHDFDQIAQIWPNCTNLTKFHNFDQISQFRSNFTIKIKFHHVDRFRQRRQCRQCRQFRQCRAGQTMQTEQRVQTMQTMFFKMLIKFPKLPNVKLKTILKNQTIVVAWAFLYYFLCRLSWSTNCEDVNIYLSRLACFDEWYYNICVVHM